LSIPDRRTAQQRWTEGLLALTVASGLAYTMGFLWWNGYLPMPYFVQPSDTFMDWFNVAGWANSGGGYEVWRSIYPPLNFVVARLFSLSKCYSASNPYFNHINSRDCDWLGIVTIYSMYLMCLVVVSFSLIKQDRSTSLYRAFALIAGFPMTMALERGNILMLAFLSIVLGYGPLLKSARWRWFAAACSINFKIYLVAGLFGQLLRRRWRWFEGVIVTTIFVYAATYTIYGSGLPITIFDNLTKFLDIVKAETFTETLYAATFNPHIEVLTNNNVPIDVILGNDFTDPMLIIFVTVTRITQVAIVLAAVAIWLRPEVVSTTRATNLALSLALVTVDMSIYSYVMTIFFTFLERWRGFGAKWAIVSAYLLCVHFDYPLTDVVLLVEDSYLGGRIVEVTVYLTAGPFIRPFIFYSIPFALSCATILAVWKDIRLQGWKTRWRFRRDLPIMVGAGEAHPPGIVRGA